MNLDQRAADALASLASSAVNHHVAAHNAAGLIRDLFAEVEALRAKIASMTPAADVTKAT